MIDEENSISGGDSGQHSIRIGATMAADRDNFTRRTCPDCGLDFKTLADSNDFAWLLHDQAKKQGYSDADNKLAKILELCCPILRSGLRPQ